MEILDKGCIYNAVDFPEKERAATFPSLAQLSNGDIFCSFRVGPEKNSKFDKIKLFKSTDGGKTWFNIVESFETVFENIPNNPIYSSFYAS